MSRRLVKMDSLTTTQSLLIVVVRHYVWLGIDPTSRKYSHRPPMVGDYGGYGGGNDGWCDTSENRRYCLQKARCSSSIYTSHPSITHTSSFFLLFFYISSVVTASGWMVSWISFLQINDDDFFLPVRLNSCVIRANVVFPSNCLFLQPLQWHFGK